MNEPASNENKSTSTSIKCFVSHCYYLHLDTARRNGKFWKDEGHAHPVFEVNGKARPVLVYQEEGSDWVRLFQLTSSNKTRSLKVKPNHILLGRIIPSKDSSIPAKKSWVQCYPERYPLSLIEDAKECSGFKTLEVDPVTAGCYLRTIMEESQQDWLQGKSR